MLIYILHHICSHCFDKNGKNFFFRSLLPLSIVNCHLLHGQQSGPSAGVHPINSNHGIGIGIQEKVMKRSVWIWIRNQGGGGQRIIGKRLECGGKEVQISKHSTVAYKTVRCGCPIPAFPRFINYHLSSHFG